MTQRPRLRLKNILRLARAGYTLAQIGQSHGITQERVWQILAEAGYSIKDLRPQRVPHASRQALVWQNRWTTCANCGATVKRPPRSDGQPRFCRRPRCHAMYLRWMYHNRPDTPTGRGLRRKKGTAGPTGLPTRFLAT